MAAVVGIACLGGQDTNGERGPGTSDDQILFGQSAAFGGPAQELDREMRLGIQAAVKGLLRKSVAVNSREMRVFNVAESREVTLSNGKIVQTSKP